MYAHWGLDRSPFIPGTAPPLYFEGESQTEAAARLRFIVNQGRRLALAVGLRGVGKSRLLERFAAERRGEGGLVAATSAAGLSVRELMWQIAAQFSLGPQPTDDGATLFRRVAGVVESLRWQRDAAVVLVDDADQAGPDVRTQLVRLLAAGGDRGRLSLVLATAPGELWRLGPELLDPTDLRIDLEPWSESETVGYVQHALIEAGCDRPAFDDEALSVLYALTDGVPRQVNRLADHALLAAAAEGRESIDAGVIEAAHDALAWASPSLEGRG